MISIVENDVKLENRAKKSPPPPLSKKPLRFGFCLSVYLFTFPKTFTWPFGRNMFEKGTCTLILKAMSLPFLRRLHPHPFSFFRLSVEVYLLDFIDGHSLIRRRNEEGLKSSVDE